MISVSNVSFTRWRAASVLQSSVIDVENESDLSSPRLGVIFDGKCPTCFKTKHECPGHFGSIRLTEPMYHILWKDHLLRQLKNCDGKFSWDKQRACITKDGKLFHAYELFDIMDDPPVISVLPVPPPHVRPALIVSGALKGENDLTYRLQHILRKNKNLAKVKQCNRPPEVVNQAREQLQNAITGYIHHEKVGPTRRTRNKREYASCASRLSKKGGRIRYNLMGKRVNFTSRCVVTGDDSLKLTEVGIPISVAKTLSVPEKVTDYNRAALQDLVDNGKFNYITLENGSRSSKRTILDIGATVERHLKDGDVVILNRQPSLHKNSLMGHYVRILPYSTFRMNVSDTSPYNADFDGDEMNIHAPQTIMARCEAEEIMGVKHNIISAQANAPVIGLIQDSLLGAYLLSGATLRPHEAMQVAQCPTGCSGREIITTVLPPVTYERGGVKIIEGVFLEGRLIKRDIGKSRGSLIQVIYNDFGPDVCTDFMFNLQTLAHRYLQIRGFTIGIKDLIRSEEAERACVQERETAFREAADMDDPNPRLNACRAVMGRAVMQGMNETNNFWCMVHSGSKGSMVNITQIQGCLGQVNVQGGRIPLQWTGRTATEYARGDNTPAARGFVSHSYLEGLTPFEMFAHSMSGREGLIDTAIKTAQTGYTERKLMKCLENIKSHSDGTVRDRQRVIQFKYGDDGFDAVRIETQSMKPLEGAREADLKWLTEDTYHFPVPIHRIVRRMRLFGGVGTKCGRPVNIDSDNALLRAFINVHTPEMIPSVRSRYEREIQKYLDKAYVCPGEGLGALAAQSIGERTTQCTLNSVDYNEWMVLRGYPKDASIGVIIDEIMEKGYKEENGSHVAPVRGLQILTVDELGVSCWKRVTHVTRHPPREFRSSSLLVKITLESGRKLTASRAKSFLVYKNRRLVPTNGASMRKGLLVPVVSYYSPKDHGCTVLGGFLGAYYASGRVDNGAIIMPKRALSFFKDALRGFHPTYTMLNDEVRVYCERLYYMVTGFGDFPTIIHLLSVEARHQFCKAYITLKGMEDEDGYVGVPASEPIRNGISNLLDGFGIDCVLSDRGLMLDPNARAALNETPVAKKRVRYEKVVEVEHIASSHPFVYDLTVEDTKNMTMLNGIACRDTFHFAGIGSKNVTLGIPRLQEILGCSKHPKTPLTTVSDRGALALKYDCLSDITLASSPSDHIDNYWDFPDKGVSKYEAEARWGMPTRIVLNADYDILDMFEYAAYHKMGDRLVVDAYGEIQQTKGVPGAEWCKWIDGRVETTLQDLSEVMLACNDLTDLYTNDIVKMQRTYGIEAARSCLLIEIRKILNHYGIYLNVRHLLLLVDAMTFCGVLTPLTRHGLKKSEASALKRCTFEEVVSVLADAAIKEETDHIDEVSACILTGKVAALGGNTVTVMKDHVIEKKFQVARPAEEEGADMWMPIQTMVEPKSPTYSPNKRLKSRPQSPTYLPW